MGFKVFNEQNRQRVSLSNEAKTVIDHDIIDFNLKNMNTIVNLILAYREKNNITQEAQMREYHDSTCTLLMAAGIDPDKDNVLDKLCAQKKKEIRKALEEYGQRKRGKEGFYVRISNEMKRWLESPDNTESEFYEDLLPYLNHILEEYASKDLYTRESIVMHDRITELKSYIDNEDWINIFYPDGTSVRIFPYKILPDKMNTHAYLACYMLNKDETKLPGSYRISALPDDMKVAYGYNPDVTSEEKTLLDTLITERRVDFLTNETADIKVRLNQAGIHTYIRAARLRPDIVSEEEDTRKGWHIYNFRCTELQAQYYFRRFGADAEILSPASLRKKFKEMHLQAANLYK